ncbi:hypothetical protein [Hyalangium sp.]|uniref:TRAFAC clade GTPase domain-containing protein n=1 Tax=Hyalangium sp. TaxID=2028555 RepID=UPI002D33031E|nr:hypothetical protein [Hyalangium sp.]HYH96087.1 hypothetical protein [Hyalangium sp.]
MLLGGPNSGKTHFAGQLYGRLQRRPGVLRLRSDQGTPPDLSAVEEVLRCLENGHAAEHTAANTWAEVLLPLANDQGNAVDLRWPDYGGEQLRSVFDQRAVPESWRSRLITAEGWVLLIRLKIETAYPDALAELVKRSDEPRKSAVRAKSWDANAEWVELLQILLHVAELGSVMRLRRPRLAVLLSCYDELGADGIAPREVFARSLPLVSSFIDNTWAPESVSIWGLSALGRLLERDSADEQFIDNGPEFQGWVVPPEGGPKDPDLSKPLAWLLRGW